MFNLLKINEQDVKQIFDISAIDILINDEPAKGIITNDDFIRETEDRNLHTLTPLKTGDKVTYKNEEYLIISETITKRYNKFKGFMRHCNYTLKLENVIGKELIGYDEKERPIYKEIYGEPIVVPLIVSQKTFSIDERYAIRVSDEKTVIIFQDSDTNRKKLKVNETFSLMDKTFKIVNHDKTVRGLIVAQCEKTTS